MKCSVMKRNSLKGAGVHSDVAVNATALPLDATALPLDATTLPLNALPETLTSKQLATIISSTCDKKTAVTAILMVAMNTGVVIDTKFFAFSRRRSAGGVDRPLPLYTNSTLLMAGAPYFISMLSGGFAENRIASLDEGFPRDKEYLKDEYDYDSDSDLEDEHEDELENANVADEEVGSRSGATGASSSQPQIQAREGKQPERRSFLQNEEDVSVPPLEPAPVAALAAAGEKYGRVIALPTGAHRTWGALLSYLYTGGIQFAPLKTNPDQSRAKQKFFSPQCSPKSMYRLADRYGLEALKKKAQDEIKAQLSPDNIMQELRSSLTSFYDEIRDMEVKFACETAQLPRVIEGPELSKWITDLAAGELTHTANNLHALVRQIGMSKTQNRTLPLCTGCFRSYPDCDFSCTSCGGYMHLV